MQHLEFLAVAPFLPLKLELYPHTTVPGFSYCRTAYHYARPGLADDIRRVTPADLRHLAMPADWQPMAAGRADGGVFHQAEALVVAGPKTLLREDNMYSAGRLMVWQPSGKGEELTLKLPITADGLYDINLIVCQDGSSGTVSTKIDGEPAKDGTLDLFVPDRTLLRVKPFRAYKLTKGDHTLTLRYEGPSPAGAGVSRPAIGLDYVWLQKGKDKK